MLEKELQKYAEPYRLCVVASKVPRKDGVIVNQVNFFYDDKPEEFVNIPSDVFDIENLQKSGNLNEIAKVRFSPGVDIDTLDRVQDSLIRIMPYDDEDSQFTPEPTVEPTAEPTPESTSEPISVSNNK